MSSGGVAVEAIGFGAPQRRLIGVLNTGNPEVANPVGIVICNPFGQEAIRAHRMMRVLAERLARDGHSVFRFDYFGTGDSMGGDQDGELEGWSDDVGQADRELRARTGVSRTAWVGMRLGATVALQAAQRAPDGLERLVLWDPVLDGPRYLTFLRERHVSSLERAFSLMPIPRPTDLARDPARFRDEAIGFALAPTLRTQLASMTVAERRWPARPAQIIVLSDPAGADGRDVAAVCASDPARTTVVEVRHDSDWTSDTANNTALVPTQALMQLTRYAGGGS